MNKKDDRSPILCKYLGLTECGEDCSTPKIRLDPFKHGTFRATQPSDLNDVLSETKCLAYFNEFSPADFHVAEVQLQRDNLAGEQPSAEYVLRHLKNNYNSPRYTPDIFPGLSDGTKISKSDFEDNEFFQAITVINSELINRTSLNYGVLSLAQDCFDPLMWCHYSANGRGICIEFAPDHPYLTQNKPQSVSYAPEDRLQFSYFEGTMRINGVYIKRGTNANDQIVELGQELTTYFSEQQINQAILYTKSEQWAYENEKRITYSLKECKLTKRNCDGFFVERAKAIYCAVIPFSAFKNVYLGYAISPEDREAVVSAIGQNCELSHVTIFETYPCPTGVLRTRIVS